MGLKILVVGAGVCGPAFATLLQRALLGHEITILERFSSLRATGQQIDVKREAPLILERMGLMEEVKSRCVNESGVNIVDAGGRTVASFGITPAGERSAYLTSEYEIMRGDMVQVLYDASLQQDAGLRKGAEPGHGSIRYVFSETVTGLQQDTAGVDVTLKSGRTCRYDLVVAADGQASRTRRLAFGKDFDQAAFKPLGVHAAYYTVPHIEAEDSLASCFIGTAGRMVFTRPSGRPVTGVLAFTTTRPSPKLASSQGKPVDAYKEAFIDIFKGSRGQEARLLEGIRASDDFYWNELGQIKAPRLFTGRVVLLGDAGYGPSPFTGMGANLSLLGAYVLAGEVARHGDDVGKALEAYQCNILPKVGEYQKLSTRLINGLFPSSYLGVLVVRAAAWVMSKAFQRRLQQQEEHSHDETLLEYPELNLQC